MGVDVSLVMPAHDAAGVLPLSLASALLPTHFRLQVIVVDDGSRDATRECVEAFQADFPQVQYLWQPHRGAAAARNLGIEAASGRYIAFLDSDDLWLPGKLDAQLDFMQREQVVFSYGDYQLRDRATGALLHTHMAPAMVSHATLLRGCPIGCLTAAYDQHSLGKVYMPDVRRGQDWGLWLALTRLGGPARKYPGVRAVYHTGGASLSADKLGKVHDVYRIYRQQERLGRMRSGWFLAQHIYKAIRGWT